MLHELLSKNRDEIVRRCERKLRSRHADRPRDELLDAIPGLLDEFIKAEQREAGLPVSTTMPRHSDQALQFGRSRYRRGYPISDLVLDIGMLSDVIGELATEQQVMLDGKSYKLFDECLDNTVAQAINSYAELERADTEQNVAEWVGSLGHELRNSINSAQLAFEVLKSGRVGIDSRTGAILQRSLARLESLVAQTLAAAHLRAGKELAIQRLPLRPLVEDVVESAHREREIVVEIVIDPGLAVDADASLLESAMSNLVQNALKFTRTEGTIFVRARQEPEWVVIEIEDECGGLGERDPELLFVPFHQGERGKARGSGLGLAISRKAIEAHAGTLHVRDAAPKGCVFTIRLPVPA